MHQHRMFMHYRLPALAHELRGQNAVRTSEIEGSAPVGVHLVVAGQVARDQLGQVRNQSIAEFAQVPLVIDRRQKVKNYASIAHSEAFHRASSPTYAEMRIYLDFAPSLCQFGL